MENKMKIGFYDNPGYKSTIFYISSSGEDYSGFIFNSDKFENGKFGDSWSSSFNVPNKDFQISNEAKESILKELSDSPYLNEVLNFFNTIKFKIKKNYLVREGELISVNSISRATKINDNIIELNIFGEIMKIYFSDFERLQREIIKEVF